MMEQICLLVQPDKLTLSGSELFSYAWDGFARKDDGNKSTVFLD